MNINMMEIDNPLRNYNKSLITIFTLKFSTYPCRNLIVKEKKEKK
jgi:hypothetical protein